MSSPEYSVIWLPHELQKLMENWSNTPTPVKPEEVVAQVHNATTIFPSITTEAGVLLANQTTLVNALTTALARIAGLEFKMFKEHPDDDQALAAIQDLE